MNYAFTARFIRSYHKFPTTVQDKFDKQLAYLIGNLQHPSLRAKKFIEEEGIWQARVDRSTRFYFLIQEDTYIILDIKTHPK